MCRVLYYEALTSKDEKVKWCSRKPKMTGEGTEFLALHFKNISKKTSALWCERNDLSWFQSYLTNRKQYVEVNGASSDALDVMCGVSQGSVLDPLLFLIFINDLLAVCKKLKFYLFADDTNMYFESDSLDLLEKTMNKELRKVDKWLTTNRLALNVDESHFVLFHSSSNTPHRKIRIKIRNKRSTEENDVKFLGVFLDSTLSWKPHITELSKKLSRTIGILQTATLYHS